MRLRLHIFKNIFSRSARKFVRVLDAAAGVTRTIKSLPSKQNLFSRKYSLTSRLIRFRSDAARQAFLVIANPRRGRPRLFGFTWPMKLPNLFRTPSRKTELYSACVTSRFFLGKDKSVTCWAGTAGAFNLASIVRGLWLVGISIRDGRL